MKMYNNKKKMERKVVEEEEKISTLHGMCPFVRTALLTANSLAHSSSVFFSNGFLSLLFNFRFYVHTDVYVFWKTKSCLIFDIHLSFSLDPLAVAIFVTHTHTKKGYNEWNEYKGGPSCRHADHFHRPQPFFIFYTQKRNGEGSPPHFSFLYQLFLAKTFFSSRW